jgi:hypothetical protein
VSKDLATERACACIVLMACRLLLMFQLGERYVRTNRDANSFSGCARSVGTWGVTLWLVAAGALVTGDIQLNPSLQEYASEHAWIYDARQRVF